VKKWIIKVSLLSLAEYAVVTIDPKRLLIRFFFLQALTRTVGFRSGLKQKVSRIDKNFAAQLLQILKSSNFKENLIHVLDVVSVGFFSVTYFDLYLAKKCA